MASDRQIAANRRNARKSTGPKSRAGKQRAARNSWRHGLAAKIAASVEQGVLIDKLASEIVGKMDHIAIRECASLIAATEIELDRIRRIRVGLIEGARVMNLDQEDSVGEKSFSKGAGSVSEIDETAEAVCRALPHLTRIMRYERRAVRKRDEAIRRLIQLRCRESLGG